MVIQVYALTINAEEAEIEWFYSDVQDLLEITPKKHISWVLVLKGLVGLNRTIQLQLLQRYWLGHTLGLL